MKLKTLFWAVPLTFLLYSTATADTIRLKNGEVVTGRIVNYAGGAFTVEIQIGSYSDRVRARIDLRDVETIEFDGRSEPATTRPSVPESRNPPTIDRSPVTKSSTPTTSTTQKAVEPPSATSASIAKELILQVPSREEWTYANVTVRRGDRISLSASGKIKLSSTKECGPEGIALDDKDKLIASSPTGSLIAVIGDDNDDFIFIGKEKEFTAARDGKLFLSVNEGNLNDNEGSFSVRIRIDPKK